MRGKVPESTCPNVCPLYCLCRKFHSTYRIDRTVIEQVLGYTVNVKKCAHDFILNIQKTNLKRFHLTFFQKIFWSNKFKENIYYLYNMAENIFKRTKKQFKIRFIHYVSVNL